MPRTITLTTDPDLRAKLERKLDEYQRRLEKQTPGANPHATYKRDILEQLILRECVEHDEFITTHAREHGWYDPEAFADAFKIIDRYNNNQGDLVRYGTGLT